MQRVHQFRAEEAAILVGKNTVLQDNPKLNLRHFEGNGILRIAIDKDLEIPEDKSFIDNSEQTIIYNEKKEEEQGKTLYAKLNFSKEIIPQIMSHLYKKEIQSLIIEGGAYTLSSFIESGIWDEARVFEGAQTFNGGIKAPELKDKPYTKEEVLNDTMFLYKNKR